MAIVEYLDFEIEIGLGQGREYPLAVIRSPGGEARERMVFPFDELALASRLKDLQIALLRSGGKRRQTLSSEESIVQEFGQKLFDALMSGEIRSRYDVSQREAAQRGLGMRIKLRIQAPELASLPWEFLYDGRRAEYICLSTQTPLVRYIELPQVIQPLLVTPPLRILGLTASPIGLARLDTENEKQRVEHALKDLIAAGQMQITWLEHANRRELQRILRHGPWHILHFIGHGGFDPANDEGFIALESEHGELDRLPATQLARLLADHVSLRLAILNSCDGAQGGSTDVFSSTASMLVRRGIPAVLAMQYEITDRAAIEFARGFYEALADDLPVDAATAEARKSVSLELTNTIEWGTPVLFMRGPDGVLFKHLSSDELTSQADERERQIRLRKEAIEREDAERIAREQAKSKLIETVTPIQISTPEPKKKIAPGWLSQIFHKIENAIAWALEKNSQNHYARLHGLMTALGTKRASVPKHAKPSDLTSRSRWKGRRQASLLISFALIVSLGLLWWAVLATSWIPCVTTSSNGIASACTFNSYGQIRPLISSPSFESGLPTYTLSGFPVFSSNRYGDLKLYTIDGRTIKAIPNTSGGWSPAARGNYVYFVSNRDGKSRIYYMDIATAEVMPVDQYPKAYDCWSPAPGQGGYLYFVANKDWETEIYYMDSKGNVEQLTSSPGPVSNWSPAPAASGTVYFVSNRDQYIGIYYVDRQKGRIRLTPDNQESWGPVPGLFGTLFFTSNESGKAEIYKRNWLGQITRVTFTPDPYETWTGPKNEKSLSPQP